MNLRKILIVVASVIILILFILVSYISYDYGMNYGVRNAETIRIEKAKISEVYDKQIKSVLVKKVKNTKIRNKISSTGRAVSLNNITI